MKRDITICFRTTEELRSSLLKLAGEARRSLSAVIENVLNDSLKRRVALSSSEEKRRHPRKDVCLPAFISAKNAEGPCTGIILDISLTGLRLSLPTESGIAPQVDDQGSRINILFTLPKEKAPVAMTCKPARMQQTDGEIEVGASFADCDLLNYQKVQNYMLQ